MTWDALLNDRRYGPAALRRRCDYVKRNVFGTSAPDDDLETALDPIVVEYCAKLVALQVIPAGAEYWAAQKISDSAGERQVAMWTDRAAALWKLHDALVQDVADLKPEADAILGTVRRVVRRRPLIKVSQNDNDAMLTPNVSDFERQAAVPDRNAI